MCIFHHSYVGFENSFLFSHARTWQLEQWASGCEFGGLGVQGIRDLGSKGFGGLGFRGLECRVEGLAFLCVIFMHEDSVLGSLMPADLFYGC